MTDLTRRSFFRLVAGAAALVSVPHVLHGLTLWGDGKHDDTAALQALIDGKPVSFGPAIDHGGARYVDGVLTLVRGRFKLTDTIVFREAIDIKQIDASGSTFEAHHDKDMFFFKDARFVAMNNCTLSRMPGFINQSAGMRFSFDACSGEFTVGGGNV